jgi:hypothetical protein
MLHVFDFRVTFRPLGIEKPRRFFNTNPGPRGPIRVEKPRGFFNTPSFGGWLKRSVAEPRFHKKQGDWLLPRSELSKSRPSA